MENIQKTNHKDELDKALSFEFLRHWGCGEDIGGAWTTCLTTL